MATKQQKAVKSAITREKKRGIMREERHVLWFLVALILLLLYLLFAQHNGWWPYSRPKLGSAFYTNLSAQAPVPASSEDSKKSDSNSATNTGGGGTGTGSGNTNTGNNGGSGTGSGGNNDNSPTPADNDNSILDLAGVVNVGNTKASISGQANGLNEHCAVVVSAVAQTVGKQEVCTYSQGDKIVTVTYLNDRVISASKSGF